MSNEKKTSEQYQKELSEPFEEHDVEWRVQQSGVSGTQGNYKPWVLIIPYLTNRAVQQRLDDVFGVDGWENVFKETNSGKGYLCGLRVKFGDEWITKWDGAEYTTVETLKGALSGSMKRAAVQLGVGRYLYAIGEKFPACALCDKSYEATGNFIKIKLDKRNKNSPVIGAQWFTPELPEFALPQAKFEKELESLKEAETLDDLRKLFNEITRLTKSLRRTDITDKAIKIKDDRKVILEAKQKAKTDEAKVKFNKWWRETVKVKITGAENESILDKNFKDAKVKLEGWCKQLNLNIDENLAALNKKRDDRINSLRTGS